ncbi:MAG: 50S ribosomal protein L15 [Candidatus Ratteibacteria bacterium]|jgi:large subunit ribosomal protein L15
MKLNEIGRPKGSNRPVKRRGRGGASGHGGTSTRGHKGQKSRTGGGVRPGFEGGQMPLIRRIPKLGFTSRRKDRYQIINVKDLSRFPENTLVDYKVLFSAGLVKKKLPVKILGSGDLKVSLKVEAGFFSKQAEKKITAAKGQAIVITIPALKTKPETKNSKVKSATPGVQKPAAKPKTKV